MKKRSNLNIMLRLIGLVKPLTGFMNFLSQMYEVLPVITPVGFVNADGDFLEEEELSEEEQAWLDTYEVLNYCGLIDQFEEARPMFHMADGAS